MDVDIRSHETKQRKNIEAINFPVRKKRINETPVYLLVNKISFDGGQHHPPKDTGPNLL